MKALIALTLLVGATVGATRLSHRSPNTSQNPLPRFEPPARAADDTAPALTKSPVVDPEALRRWEAEARVVDGIFDSARRAYYKGRVEDAERLARQAMEQGRQSSVDTHGAQKLLGRILMDKGDFRGAAETLSQDWVRGQDPAGDLDIALCYAKLGRFDLAQRFYDDQAILQYRAASVDDLPDATTARGAEARILIARGLEASTRLSGKYDAQRDFARAALLAPRNTLAAQMMARSLLRDERNDEALPYLATIVAYGKGERRREADARFSQYPKVMREKALSRAQTKK